MSAIPKGVLGSRIANFTNEVNEKIKSNTMLYAFSFILLVEIASATVLRDTISKGCNPYWYVLLTQLVLLVVFLNLNYSRKLLRFCQRQILIVRSLTAYYFIGCCSLIFNISDNNYINIVKWMLIIFASIILILTIFVKIRRNKK